MIKAHKLFSVAFLAMAAIPFRMTDEEAAAVPVLPAPTETQLALMQRVQAALIHGYQDVEDFLRNGIESIEAFIVDKKAAIAADAALPTEDDATDATPDVTAPAVDLSLPVATETIAAADVGTVENVLGAPPAVEIIPVTVPATGAPGVE